MRGGVAALVTPARHPLKSVLDSRVNNRTPNRSRHSDLFTRGLSKTKRKSKRLSAPPSNLTQLIPDLVKALKHSPVLESPDIKCDSPRGDGKGKPELHLGKSQEIILEGFVEKVVGKILKENEPKWKEEPANEKMNELEKIILQMNKERLLLEKQLADLKKSQSRSKALLCSPLTISDIQNATFKEELELKEKELSAVKSELCQVQDMLLELPVLRSDLLKSKQETKAVNGVLFTSRKENAGLKDLITNLRKEIQEKETFFEQQQSEFQGRINVLTQQNDQTFSEFQRVNELVEEKDEQLKRNSVHGQNLLELVNRLESVAAGAEKYVSLSNENERVLQYQIDELSLKLDTNSELMEESKLHCQEMEEELQLFRQREGETKEECSQLLSQIDSLVAEMDVHKMEITRQRDLVRRQQTEINSLKVELSSKEQQMEYMQSQQDEMKEFTEEERRNLEGTVREMESQLKTTNLEMTELDVSLRCKSEQCAELMAVLKQSKSLLQDKQEELDATQSQAHWLVLQQEAVMAETANELTDISDLVSDLLRKFNDDAFLGELGVESQNPQTEVRRALTFPKSPDSEREVINEAPKSLVESVLKASAMRDNDMEPKPANNLNHMGITKLSPIAEALEEELDFSVAGSESEEKLPSLTEQVLDLKEALKQLAKMLMDRIPTGQAQNTLKRVEEERAVTKQGCEASSKEIRAELEESRTLETKLRREVARKSSEISALQMELKENRENLQHSFRKIETLSQQLEKTIEQQSRIADMSFNLQRYSEEVKTLQIDRECLFQQLTQCLTILDELPSDKAAPDVLGKVMAEKFSLEKRVQQLKEKAMTYRLETQDYMTQYKHRADSKIRILKGNLEKAETEICRLDALVEKIRVVLHQYSEVISACPDLLKLLSFLNGEDV